jgi:hypothetical protein
MHATSPNIIPDFNGFKYEAGQRRLRKCPFNGSDAQWIEDRLVPALNGMMASAARQAGVSFVSLENAFDGHRLCGTLAMYSSLSVVL